MVSDDECHGQGTEPIEAGAPADAFSHLSDAIARTSTSHRGTPNEHSSPSAFSVARDFGLSAVQLPMIAVVIDPASSTRRTLRSDSVKTQAKLINVAERLFAERGIDAVSLSEINRVADQGNNSALHYHFGSKEGLLDAIRAKHKRQIRSEAKDSFAALPARPSAHDVVTAFVQPVASRLDDPDGGSYYLRICTQAMTNPSHSGFGFGDEATPDEFQPFGPLIWELASGIPTPLRSQRVSLMTATLFIGLASIAEGEAAFAELSDQRVVRVNNLIDSIAGLLTAPASRSRRSWSGEPEASNSPILIELDDHAGGRADGDRVVR